jgi:hypothetical protein
MNSGWLRVDRLALATFVLALAGCSASSGSQTVSGVDYAKVRNMTEFYNGYLSSHRNQPPANEQAFRSYLDTKQDALQKLGLTADDILKSPRNGKPLQWIYGKMPQSRGGVTYLAYESESVEGKRLVLGTRGMYEEMEETKFKTVFPKTP